MDPEDRKKYSQHGADVISLKENALVEEDLEIIFSRDIKADKELFSSFDTQTATRLQELGYSNIKAPYIFNFNKLLKSTRFPWVIKEMLALLARVYNYPVDIEFTANFTDENRFRINLLQCRPLQTRGLGNPVEIPVLKDDRDCFFAAKGNFMGGNVRLPVEFVVFVKGQAYRMLNERDKYDVARKIGMINAKLKGKNVMLLGPGRWGTTTPSLGVPVHFAELCNMSVICEVSSAELGFMPELSYGSHFFQDLVETGIFYAAIIEGNKGVVFNPEKILAAENLLTSVLPQGKQHSDVIHIAKTDGMEIYSDIVTQTLICR